VKKRRRRRVGRETATASCQMHESGSADADDYKRME
jgi:hypothetical protein